MRRRARATPLSRLENRNLSPGALLARLQRVSPMLRRALVVAVASGVVTTVAIVGQACALAGLLGSLFYDAHAGWARDVGWFALATLVRALALGSAEPSVAFIARPLRHELRRRSLTRLLVEGASEGADASIRLATRGVDAVENYVATFVPSLLVAVLAPIVLLGWLWWRDWLSALIIALCLALLPVFMVLLGLEARSKMAERWREQQSLAGYFGDVVRGMTVLKSFNRSRDALDSLDEAGASLARTTMATLRVAFLSGFALELLSSLATALVALTLGLRLLSGRLGLDVALAVLIVTPEVFLPLRKASAQFHASADGVAAAAELLGALEQRPRGGTTLPPTSPPTIELREVSLSREGRREGALVSGWLAGARVTTVVGPSGSGKTTLLRIIAGLDEPASGEVLVDGVPLADLSLAAWRERVAWLPQDPTLPGATVAEAIAMGDASITPPQMRAALARVGLDLELERPLGEGAGELSAGERRRLALVRCLVREPSLLVLDEPTSHLDEASAALVERAILDLEVTRVVATHRPFRADQVIDLAASVRRG